MDAFANGWWGLEGLPPGHAGFRRAAVVAVPVRNEERRIIRCLERLTDQASDRCSLSVILLLNNCRDGTAEAARSVRPRASCPVTIREIELPTGRAHVGWARRLAMDEAAGMLDAAGRPDGLILTTDADTLVGDGWVEANLAEIEAGADAVAGALELDPTEEQVLPVAVRRRVLLERRFAGLAAEIDSRLDPVAHDPWPSHRTASGASLAVTLAAYRRVGGLPTVPVGEDRAFLERLSRAGLRVRHSAAVRVTTSCRSVGRAAGGMADTLRMRASLPDLPCDPGLEAVAVTCRRARWRAGLRRLAELGRLREASAWAPALRLTTAETKAVVSAPGFGEAWTRVEALSPLLRRVPLAPRTLVDEIARAERLLEELAAPVIRGAGRPADSLASDAA